MARGWRDNSGARLALQGRRTWWTDGAEWARVPAMAALNGVLVDGALHLHPAPLRGVTPTWPGCDRKPILAALTALQKAIAAKGRSPCSKPGGKRWSICTCSLEAGGKARQAASRPFWRPNPALRRAPVEAGEVGGPQRHRDRKRRFTDPCLPFCPIPTPWLGGFDGFYAAASG